MQIDLTNVTLSPFWLLLLGGIAVVAKPMARYVIKRVINDAAAKLLTDTYDQNLAELLPSFKRFSIINFIELSLRAEEGKVITRPLGSPKHFPGYDMLMFSPRQLTGLPFTEDAPIDISVTIGPAAAKPLTIDIPLMIGGMAYGVGLSEEAKIALAKAANMAKTVANSGEGPFLPEEAKVADKFVLQICNWPWGDRTDKQIAAAAMLEVKMGQGADTGPSIIEAKDIAGRARVLAGAKPNADAVGLPAPPGVKHPDDWPAYIQRLRKSANGIPIALKIMATDHLEEELAVALKLGFDAIAIGGCEGGSHAVQPTRQDDFGIPSLYALARAKRFLKDSKVSLIVCGGYFTPGQCLKAFALGADAIYLGTVPLFALGHNQTAKVLPWEPPTTLIYYNSPSKTKLNIDQAATSVANVLTSMALEIKDTLRTLGKSSLKELTPDDLVALDALTAEVTGVKQAYIPCDRHGNKISHEKWQYQDLLAQLNQHIHYARQTVSQTEDLLQKLHQSHGVQAQDMHNEPGDANRLH